MLCGRSVWFRLILKPPASPQPPDLPDEPEELEVEPSPARVRAAEGILAAVDLADRKLESLVDLELRDGSWANARAEGALLRRLELDGVRATGAELSAAVLQDVTITGSRFDLTSFRYTELERVVFRDCRLDETDFHGAKLISVLFERTTLVRANLVGATVERCELRACDLTGLSGIESLRGSRMPRTDVFGIAELLAVSAGIELLEE